MLLKEKVILSNYWKRGMYWRNIIYTGGLKAKV